MIVYYAMAAALVAAAYLVGSIPTGVLIARARGVDLRAVGSGNIGATNAARALGKKLGLVVLVLDALKGALPMLAVLWWNLDRRVDPFVITACGTMAIGGHCFSVWLRFRGGKGVATALGVFLVADPLVTGLVIGLFAGSYALFRVVSIGSLIAALAMPCLLVVLGRSDAVVTLAIAAALIILIKHRGNLRRLARRQEHRV